MAHHALKVAVPVHGDKVWVAAAIALGKEVVEPLPSTLCARDGGRAQLDAQVFERLDFRLPACGCYGDAEVGAAGAVAAVGLVEGEDVRNVCSRADELLDRVEEGGPRVAGASAPEHGDKVHVGVVCVGGRGVFLVVVVPGWG